MTISPFAINLLDWFATAARVMPWRAQGNPYFIWVSEIMLQQTQVTTVTPYFERFIERFPTVKALAEAPLDDVLKLWEGLGYYSRARNLHRGAHYVLTHFGGVLPRNAEQILEIPGIGPYSAGAILSIAYGVPEPAIDGNVIRVFSRLYALQQAFDKAQPKRDLDRLVRDQIPTTSPGDFNQALMELGALVCRPKNPDCLSCPVVSHCKAYREGEPTRYPFKGKKTAVKAVKLPVIWLQHPVLGVLMKQQNQKGIFKGLWCLPALSETLPFAMHNQGLLTQVEHTLTHRQLSLEVYRCSPVGVNETGAFEVLPEGWAWVHPDENKTYAIPVAYQKVFRFVKAHPLLLLMSEP